MRIKVSWNENMKFQSTFHQECTLKFGLKWLRCDVDSFVTKLESFERIHTGYKEDEITKFIKTVKDFKDMFCCDNPSSASNVHEERVIISSNTEGTQRDDNKTAELKNLLAEREKELKEQRAKIIEYEKELEESTTSHQTDLNNFQQELSRRQLYIKEIKESLNEQNIRAQQLLDEIKNLQMRNSRLLSSQEEGGVQFKDKYLPGKIASLFKTLFREHYSDARYFLKEKNCTDDQIYYHLGNVLWGAIELTKEAVKEGQMAAKEAILKALSLKHCEKNDDKDLPNQMEKEIFRRLRQYPSREKQKYITEKIMKRYQWADGSNKSFRRYVEECVRVTWLMNASSPPMYASFDDQNVCSEKHEVRDGTGDKIRYWIWPCIYFSEQAYCNHEDVLVMGVVVAE
ncbi:uncharacterized protein LOC130629944 isoform X2 [Hydractinia symbiolongicarpus]|uniref:uncharacterized protein LOC130629944 isoform X2 n=1 Tax=Hydractinia symbiolongicarpus TaxID=13093 RepID=UPI00254BDB7F|nr:uncharacterized protein LOC130629944 isoform X2 [Hydractinia symbiolongicarpus]